MACDEIRVVVVGTCWGKGDGKGEEVVDVLFLFYFLSMTCTVHYS